MRITEEEKIAIKLSALLSDMRLDIDEVGETFATIATTALYLRLEQVYYSARKRAGIE
jgi:hypothetical protein